MLSDLAHLQIIESEYQSDEAVQIKKNTHIDNVNISVIFRVLTIKNMLHLLTQQTEPANGRDTIPYAII